MSQFSSITLACPGCGAELAFEAVHSVNADRSPLLRAQILDESFQRVSCPQCQTDFRLEPDLNYVEHDKRLWIAVRPLGLLTRWPQEEQRVAALFEQVYGAGGSPYMRRLGLTLRRRLVFGWAALREKLLADDIGLDDLVLELTKAAVLRSSSSAPVGLGAELRLLGGDAQQLLLAWLHSADETPAQRLRVARSLYDEIAADAGGAWAELRGTLGAGPFVDMNRMLVAVEAGPG